MKNKTLSFWQNSKEKKMLTQKLNEIHTYMCNIFYIYFLKQIVF